MHTIGIFKKSSEAKQAASLLEQHNIPSAISTKETSSDQTLFLLKADDAETEAAHAALGQAPVAGLMTCDNCGSHQLEFPATPNHTMLSRIAGAVAVKTHLIDEHVICSDCRNEWSP